jgi:NifU-like protein involved in Fe-S cluster formation
VASPTVLYTPEVLGLATELARYPWDDSLPLAGSARSKSCGSSLSLGIGTDAAGRIDRIGLKTQACAIGQAAAAIFARGASGRGFDELARAGDAIAAWLSGEGDMPCWPGLEAIAAARAYPARHGAILLAWRAASELLPTA